MGIKKFFVFMTVVLGGLNGACADSLFFDDEPVQDGLPVFEVSKTFAEIYQKLDDVNWAGKNLNVAIESIENLNKNAHVAATDERVVLVWGDDIVANFPRPAANDWNGFGEITTALILKMRAYDSNLRGLSESEMYQAVVDSLIRGVDENGRYVFSKAAEITEDGRLLTSVGIEGARDSRGNFRVNGIYKGAPADMAGIRAGDLIEQINGRYVADMSDEELNAVMTGFNSGTSKIHLLTPAGNKDVVLRRATIVLADADVVRRLDPDTGGLLEIIVHNVSDGAVSIINEALARYPDVSG
ncbi:MAG: PDZ domain-containing protein, partial [Alphaproteobacteria bacterium]|nr:PDZ domain-containing protein [Alphaproteobacteria bacterium]